MTLTKFDKKMFKVAKEVAKTSNFKEHHLGCVIAYKRHIIAVGANSNKTHPTQCLYNAYRSFMESKTPIKHSLHAEIDALMSIPYPVAQKIDWKKVKIYVYRICNGKNKKVGLAKPCEGCMAAIKDFGIRHLYYTTDEGGYAYIRLKN